MTSAEVCKFLKISNSTLSLYVKAGWLHRHGPEYRKYKFYLRSEVEAFEEMRTTFGKATRTPPVAYKDAMPEDIKAIVAIDNAIFDAGITTETYARWQRKNPEAFFVLRTEEGPEAGKVVGYACIVPMRKEVMERFVKGEITRMDDISPDDIGLYEPGKPLHVYIIALGIDPAYRTAIKHEYGATLVRGLFTFLMRLAQRGVEITTLTARTRTPDGIRLLRKMGMPQLRSPVPGKHLFRVTVAESGFSPFVRYSDLLEQWKREHQPLAS